MSAETIYKLQPHRTMHLQGFGRTSGDGYGCVAAMSQASATGFTVSGQWVAQDDFAVMILWDADNVFEHPRLRYLPDWAFDGVVLEFDLELTNCMPVDSTWYPAVAWPYLTVLYKDGTTQQINVLANATPVTGAYAPASCRARGPL